MSNPSQQNQSLSHSSILNPDQCLVKVTQEKLLNPEAIRTQIKIQSALTKESSTMNRKPKRNSVPLFSKDKLENFSLPTHQNSTIHMLVKDKHKYEKKSEKLRNQWNFISQKMAEMKKKKKQQQKKKKEKEKLLKSNKSYKSFISEEINEYNDKQQEQKLKSKNSVSVHRENKRKVLKLYSEEKQLCGKEIRDQIRGYHKAIHLKKQEEETKNRSSFWEMKRSETLLEEERKKRFDQKKQRARENFNRKWVEEYRAKERAKNQSRIRKKILYKKIEKFGEFAKTLNLQVNF